MRNNTGKLIELAKKIFFKDEYLASKNDPKRFWRNINRIIPNNKSKPNHINLTDGDKGDVNPEEVSNYINTFFTTIGPSLAAKHNIKWKYHGIESREVIDEIKFSKGELLLLIDNIDITKSSGFHNISSKCLRDALSVLFSQLMYIFEQSYKLGVFPNEWKNATIVPLFKGGVKENVSNYRPVSLLPIPGKLLERVIHDHIMTFFEKNNLISNMQNGFRKNRSTLSSVIDFTSDIYKSINNKKITLAAFIDLKKAFDTVNHNILMEKLNYLEN